MQLKIEYQLSFSCTAGGHGLQRMGVVVGAFTHCLKRILMGSDRPKLSLTLKNAAGGFGQVPTMSSFLYGSQ